MRTPNRNPLFTQILLLAVGMTLTIGVPEIGVAQADAGKNPCVAANPCAANPCAAKNPCAANPCAANPCAANPCAPAPAAQLSDAAAAATYKRIAKDLRAGYAKSDHPVATAYFKWKRYNKAPYVSETHGGRFVNNFANKVAKAYRKFEKAGVMPVGSVLAKDSFGVPPANPCAANPCAAKNPCAANPCAANPCAASGKVQPGPLFIMEKMPAGFSPETGNWRYTMIMPNGGVFGATKGRNANKVQFCADCHGSADNDSMFFLPKEYR